MLLYYYLFNIVNKKTKYYYIISENSYLVSIYKVKQFNGINYKQSHTCWYKVSKDEVLLEI